MNVKDTIINFQSILQNLEKIANGQHKRYRNKEDLLEQCKELLDSEVIFDIEIAEDILLLQSILIESTDNNIQYNLKKLDIINTITKFIESFSKNGYGSIGIDYERYKLKTILYYRNENYDNIIGYMAGSFNTDQTYRTFLANIQKGKKRLTFTPVTQRYGGVYSLDAVKDGYISRVKKASDLNTQDGYHADFILNNNRFFLLRENDNPIDVIYEWIVTNTKTAILEEWKTYIYNTLVQKGFIYKAEGYNYSNVVLKGIALSEAVDTDIIRSIRQEGMKQGEIIIPRKPVALDSSMSFIDAMNEFIVPHITAQDSLYNVGEELSEHITSPIIFKKGNKLKKTYLYPRQKVMAQGIVNAFKEGRNNVILNGGMGVGKTYISIKLANTIIKEKHSNSVYKRVSVFSQSHLSPKWERQFKEALPDENLKFTQIDNYKDVMNLDTKPFDGIEVFLLPKDRVKRKYLEEFSPTNNLKLSNDYYGVLNQNFSNNIENVFIVNSVKSSEMKLLAVKLQKKLNRWVCVVKEILNDKGDIVEYRVATPSKLLKSKFNTVNKYYDFTVKSLDEINCYKSELDDEEVYTNSNTPLHFYNSLTCPDCGGLLYDKYGDQFSEDDKDNYLTKKPKTKATKNKCCSNYIKVDGTPLTSVERNLLISEESRIVVAEKGDKHPYLDGDMAPITDSETIQLIKQNKYEGDYKIVVKQCNSPLWTVQDKKGYRTVNSLDMLKRKLGKKPFLVSISDESHLYAAESSQGESFAKLCRLSKYNVALTGTLTGGKASHMFYTLYRMIPNKMSRHYKYDEVSKFINHYGRRKKVTKEYKNDSQYNKSGTGKIRSSGWNEIPGISPMLYSHFLSDIMISRKIEDMGFDMPELKFFRHDIDMSSELQAGYDNLKDDILSFMKENKHLSLGGTYINALLSYPDKPLTEPLYYEDMLIHNPKPLNIEGMILPKEQKLIDTVKNELLQGRRSLVYVTYTGTKETDKRVEKILEDAGISVALMKSSVKTEKREEWIDKQYKDGKQVIVCNPKLVQTGLDIITYPTIIFFQLDYDVRVMRQAESRAWRVGQEKQCKVYYMSYSNSIQRDALKLIGSKKKASLQLEGIISEDILSQSGDDDMGDSGVAALFKSLLGKVKLKEDSLDFFSEEETIEILEPETIEKTSEKIDIKETTSETIQLNLFTVTNEKLKETKSKKKLIVGQVSLFEM